MDRKGTGGGGLRTSRTPRVECLVKESLSQELWSESLNVHVGVRWSVGQGVNGEKLWLIKY